MRLAAIAGLFLFALANLGGCDHRKNGVVPVSGVVKFKDGGPVRMGFVEFVPTAPGPSARGKLDQQGRFTLGTYAADDGALLGTHRVIVTQPLAPAASEPREGDAHFGTKPNLVHKKHSDPETTGLEFEVLQREANFAELQVEADPR